MSLSDFLRRRIGLRRGLVLSFHVFLYALAYVGAFLIRFDFTIPAVYSKHIIVGGVLIVFLRIAAGFPFRLYGGVLKYAGIGDLVNIVKAMTAATAAFVVAAVIIGLQGFPRSIFVIDWAGSIALVGGLRFGLRVVREALTAAAPGEGGGKKRVLILGAGDAGEALVRDLQRSYRDRYDVVGFLDDNRSKQGLRIHGVPVLGPLSYLGDFAARYQVDEVIVAIPTASGKTMRTIFDICKIAGVRFKTVPGMDQLIDGRVTVSQVRDVAIDDLLGREPVKLEEGLLRRFLHEKAVMVTGAGGSIGAEMCRQVLRYKPRKLVLLEQSEPALFDIHKELSDSKTEIPLAPVIADVTDAVRLERVFSAHGPEVIFHAAAHKHVPMMEWNPGEAIKNNVFGTRVVADMANVFGAKAFVFISTDKAVNPTSVMGASKRVAEMYVQSLSADSKTKFSAVRFGNVLGSTGSVIPIFKEQIQRRGPLTVTHPEMRRYFMTIPESCQLVMQAAAMGEGGEIFVLDMGDPIKIVDLARDLIRLSGFEPDEEIRIVYTGLRPGEKLFEEIGFDAEKMEKTRHPKIYTGRLSPHSHEDMISAVEHLRRVMDETKMEPIKSAIKSVVPEYNTDVEAKKFKFKEISQKADIQPAALDPVPQPSTVESMKSRVENTDRRHAETETSPTTNSHPDGKEEKRNPVFDPVWELYLAMCQENGFLGASWATMGVQPADHREVIFLETDNGKRGVLKRSVPISSLAFVELRFLYEGDAGKKTPDRVRRAVREISSKVAKEIFKI